MREDLAIVIVAYNRPNSLFRLLGSLNKLKYELKNRPNMTTFKKKMMFSNYVNLFAETKDNQKKYVFRASSLY